MELNNVIGDIVASANRENRREEGDYIADDGLLYCGKCHTPKEYPQEWDGKMVLRPIPCKCKHEQNQRDEEARKRQRKLDYLAEMRRTGFPDAEMRKWCFEADDGGSAGLMKVARKYADNFKAMKDNGTGLLLYGDVGCGKSFAAACIANELIDRGIPCMMTNFSRIINRLQENFDGRQKYIDSLNRFDLLVIDDMAVERNTEYVWENVMNIIDSRYRSGLPIVVTTNLTIGELSDPSDIRRKRVYSRLMEMCVPLEAKGADRRTKKLERNIQNARELLGL